MKKQRGNPKGSTRSQLTVARVRLTLLEKGWKTMLIRHQEEMMEQQEKIKAAKEAVIRLEAEQK